MTHIPHGSWIFIADGAKALILRNEGEADIPHFVMLDVFRNDASGKAGERGTDRPGRTQSSMGDRRASVRQTDWHEVEEHRFAHSVAETLERHCANGDFSEVIVVAPARTLSDLRKHFSKRLHASVTAEIDKDLTKHPLYDIERILLAS